MNPACGIGSLKKKRNLITKKKIRTKGIIPMEEAPNYHKLPYDIPTSGIVACIPTQEDLILYHDEKELGRIPLNRVTDVSLIVDSLVKKSYTILRLLILGPLVILFPKKTVQEAYRLSIHWVGPEGKSHFTYIPIQARMVADHIIKTIKGSITSEGPLQQVQKIKAKKIVTDHKKIELAPVKASPFITCESCTMEFKKADLPSGGKCPVCGHVLQEKP